jgi:hypothetical protein
MLTIRRKQMAVFAEVETKKFVDRVVVHLKKFFPKQCEAMGDSQLPETIRYGIKRAASYNIKAQRDVSRYVDLMMVLGHDFDRDKRLPWAGEVLRARNSAEVRISMLLKTAQKHLRGA